MPTRFCQETKPVEHTCLECALNLADDGKIQECLETIYYAMKNYSTALSVYKVIPVIIQFVDKLRRHTIELDNFKNSRDIYSCPICCGILYEPITISCGHTYCKRCLHTDNNNAAGETLACILCRPNKYRTTYKVPVNEYRPNVLITSLVNKWWKDELKSAVLRTQANKLFREKKLEESLQLYTEAVKISPNDHLSLGNRSHVLLTLGRKEEALEVANQAVRYRPMWAKGHYRRAAALLALDTVEEAHVEALLCAALESSLSSSSARMIIAKMIVQILSKECKIDLPESIGKTDSVLAKLPGRRDKDPDYRISTVERKETKQKKSIKHHRSKLKKSQDQFPLNEAPELRRLFSKFEAELENIKNNETTYERSVALENVNKSDFECTVCYRYFWQPVTTPCGHTFCRPCLDRCLDHAATCPLCKSSLRSFLAERTLQATEFIAEAMKQYLPSEVEERGKQQLRELREFANAGIDPQHQIPIFVATLAIPSISCPLHVFEPRYRLMVRMCMEAGTREFGMCMPSATEENGYANYGTMLEIKEIKYTPDGRSIINTVGSRRFKCIAKGSKDGYNTATAEFLQDEEVPARLLADLYELHDAVHRRAQTWFYFVDAGTQRRILSHYGGMPGTEVDYWKLPDGPTWIWWLIAVLPLEPVVQIRIIRETNLSTRLNLINRILRCVHLHQNRSVLAASTPAPQ